MTDVTRLLNDRERSDPHAASRRLPLVYDDLRKLAAQGLAQEQPGRTLQPTALLDKAHHRLTYASRAPGVAMRPEPLWPAHRPVRLSASLQRY
jgi:hypothetical protein